MICPKCKTEMKVVAGFNVISGSNSANEETKLYRVIEHKCMNKTCSNNEAVRERVPLEFAEE